MVLTLKKTTNLDIEKNASTIIQVGDGSIIVKFEKTPTPRKLIDVVCPHFMELKWAYGCPFDCAWCYLKGTFRFQPTGTKPGFKDFSKIESHVKRYFEDAQAPQIFNTGELADSLMGESLTIPFSKFIIPIFENQSIHKVLFLTKSTNIKNLLMIQNHNQVIISFSLNSNEVAMKWEKLAPPINKRIQAAKELSEAGYDVRIRIDPMVPILNWENGYSNLLESIFDNFRPSRITLGSLRGLPSTINYCTDKSWVPYLGESSNWGKKVNFQIRFNIYRNIIDQLNNKYNYSDIALCKETIEMWSKLKMDYVKIKCNCIQ
jgi:spore photoproduct lyase